MKNSKTILSLISSQPQFGSLTQHSCYQKFMALLPPRFQQAIAFIYIKNETLFLALSHPGYKMELNYNRDLFKDLLGTVQKYAPECKEYHAKEVVLFNSKFHTKENNDKEKTIPYYNELSSGDFEFDFDDEKLKEKFNKSKELIAKNLNLSQLP